MKVTITTQTDIIYTIDVSPDMELENFKALCECEVGIPADAMLIILDGRIIDDKIDDKKDLSSCGVKEGDVVLVQRKNPPNSSSDPMTLQNIDFGSIVIPGMAESSNTTGFQSDPGMPKSQRLRIQQAELVWKELETSPERLSVLRQNNPLLADAFISRNQQRFLELLTLQMNEKAEVDRRRIQMMNSDPFDPEAQKLIAEDIRQDNVDMNMEAAIEYHPESFGQVCMLYIRCKVNNHPVLAFIDSGAQTTIMSKKCAERCGIMRLVDKRFEGYAKGVGVQKIVGKVHLVPIDINNFYLQTSFSILEDQSMDMLFGLDMLKRHQCCIDLKRNVLVIGTTGTETPFLNDAETPKMESADDEEVLKLVKEESMKEH